MGANQLGGVNYWVAGKVGLLHLYSAFVLNSSSFNVWDESSTFRQKSESTEQLAAFSPLSCSFYNWLARSRWKPNHGIECVGGLAMPRLFTGLEVPGLLSDQLTLLQGGLQSGSSKARWIDRDDFHLTLRFIGDIDHAMAREVVLALDRVRHGPLTLVIDGLGAFGGNKPHSVFARVAPNKDLSELQAEQERILQRLGVPAERRNFIPHVTLARCRGFSSHAVAHWLAMRGGVMNIPFEVDRFVLYSSRDSVGGGPYVVEEDYPLIPPLVA